MEITAELSIPDFRAEGRLGFLSAIISDEDADSPPDASNDGQDVDADGLLPSMLRARFAVDLQDVGGAADAEPRVRRQGLVGLNDLLQASEQFHRQLPRRCRPPW